MSSNPRPTKKKPCNMKLYLSVICIKKKKKKVQARHWWVTLIILATKEAETRKIAV
jgi:hypothetical protein